MSMDEVSIYTYTTIKSTRKNSGAFVYVLETTTSKGPATLTKIEYIEDANQNKAELTALIEALKRLNKMCNLTIYTDSDYIVSAYMRGWISEWKKKDFMNAKNNPVANQEEWRSLSNLLEKHLFHFALKQEHSYYAWMVAEAEKVLKKRRLNIESSFSSRNYNAHFHSHTGNRACGGC